MRYEWLTVEQVETLVNPTLLIRGMALLNPNACRVLGAWDGDNLIKSFTIQLFPVLGPLISHDNTQRDNGDVSRELTQRMHAYLNDSDARGYMVIADSPLTERLCERHQMMKMKSPIYLDKGKSLECNDYTSPGGTQ